MAGQFDKVARALASDMPRRKVLRLLAGGVTASFGAAILGKNAMAEGETSTIQPLADPQCNQAINFCPPEVNNTIPEPPQKVITIPVPFLNQSGTPNIPAIVEGRLPDIPGVNWNIVPIPASPGGNYGPPEVNNTTPNPPPSNEPPSHDRPGIDDIGRSSGDYSSRGRRRPRP